MLGPFGLVGPFEGFAATKTGPVILIGTVLRIAAHDYTPLIFRTDMSHGESYQIKMAQDNGPQSDWAARLQVSTGHFSQARAGPLAVILVKIHKQFLLRVRPPSRQETRNLVDGFP